MRGGFPAKPTISRQGTSNPASILSATSPTVGEAAGTATVTVSLNAAKPYTVVFDYVTRDGNATSPANYTSTSGTTSIPNGQTSVDIVVTIIDDAAVQGDHSFYVDIYNVRYR